MAYRRRYRRRYRRALSNRTIFSKTRAKSQAKQIATLRNRVGRLSKLTRKEIKNFQETFNKEYTNSSLATVHSTWTLSDNFMQGQWTKLRGLSINGILEYGDNKEGYPGISMTRSGSVRIIIYQSLQSRNADTAITSILNISHTGTDYELNTTRPLKDGVTSFVKILYDRTYTLSDQMPQRRVRIYLKKLLNLHKESGDDYARGSIVVGIVTSGLHWVSGGYTESIIASLVAKQVYTED